MARQLEHFPSLVAMFFARVGERGDRPFLWTKQAGAWTSISWAEAGAQVAALSCALQALGLGNGDRVMLVSENRPEWLIADLAIMAAGCVTVPTYVTNTERDHSHIIENASARAIIVSTPKLARTLLPAAMRSGCCETVIGIEPLRVGQSGAVRFADWAELIAAHPPDIAAATVAARRFARTDLACIIYTSGTGGSPRGVCQHHGAILRNVAGCLAILAEDFGWGDEVFLSLLPLSHAYEHSGGQFLPIALGGEIYYAEGLEKLAANIAEVRPTVMVVVPRLFEVMRARILKQLEKQGAARQWLLGRALAIGAKPRLTLVDRATDRLVSLTVRKAMSQRFGGRLKAMVSGGAPLNPEIGQFFQSLGLVILQGYGQTEAAPVISCNRPSAGIDVTSVGPPLAGVEVRIAEDGEILVRGEGVMHGYWRNEAETARVLQDGWLHTGDIGELDRAGRLKITDRKKDLIVNDKGENVAPQRIEGMLTLEPEILQAMVAGDRRPYLVGLVVPDPEWLAASGLSTADAADPAVARALSAALDRVNAGLSTTERVRRFILADEPFAIENEQLTPSLKIRRHVIRARYGERLDALYRK